VFIRLEELQKEKNAVLVSTFSRSLVACDPLAAYLFIFSTSGKDTGNQAKSPGRYKLDFTRSFLLSGYFDQDALLLSAGPDKKLRVCDVCGSYLSIFDSDK
jgi:hypothetical protein